ncbi:rRNA processing protein [Coemansia sp. RSA 1199]|nr:rRNA processing protein [Coemansia sp. RSA 1199]
MPRSSKKKQKKAEDFKKVKLKVGKKKAPAANATDTSFTARAIVVGVQSISADKSAQLTNSHNHTLKELLAQMRHYSAPTRKDAVVGLGDFAALHPAALRAELGAVISATVRLVVDNEPGVRRQLLRLYGTVLPTLEPRELAPFVPLAVIFTCSAMTHILDDIRADAVKFLDLLADAAPATVAQFAPRVLPSFFSLLETSTAAADGARAEANARTALLSQGRRLAILRSCHKFLCVFTRPLVPSSDALAFMAPPPAPPVACTEQLFFPDATAPFAALNLFGEADAGSSHDADAATDAAGAVRAQSSAALDRLYPFLQATWIESAAIFAGGNIGADDSLQLCSLTLQTLQVLWRAVYANAVPPHETRLIGFLRQCSTFFPFGKDYSGDTAVEDALLALNSRVCELAALVQLGTKVDSDEVLASSDVKLSSEVKPGSNTRPSSDAGLARVFKRATRFMLQTLGHKQTKLVRHEQFGELLAVTWQLARGGGRSDAEQLLTAVMHYAGVCPLASPSKTLAIRFLTCIIDAQWTRVPEPGALDVGSTQLAALTTTWVLQLPKLLWQLRDRNLDASLAAAVALRLVCQRTRLLDTAAADTLYASLAPLFGVDVPGKGRVHGPFRLYPPALQQAVLEAVACCPRSPRLTRAVRASIADCHTQVRVLAREIIA